MADANMKWTVDEAIRAARALQPHDPTWIEEPTIPDDPAGHARIVREGGLPVAVGENLRSLWEFKQFIAGGGVTYPEPDVTNCGGVTPFMKIAHLAEAFNMPVTIARRARRDGPPARCLPEPELPGGARLRAGALHRRAAADRGGFRGCAGPAGARDYLRLAGPRPYQGVEVERFDHIVVGGGSSGCVAAARLVAGRRPGAAAGGRALAPAPACWTCRRASSR